MRGSCPAPAPRPPPPFLDLPPRRRAAAVISRGGEPVNLRFYIEEGEGRETRRQSTRRPPRRPPGRGQDGGARLVPETPRGGHVGRANGSGGGVSSCCPLSASVPAELGGRAAGVMEGQQVARRGGESGTNAAAVAAPSPPPHPQRGARCSSAPVYCTPPVRLRQPHPSNGRTYVDPFRGARGADGPVGLAGATR